MKKSVTLDSVLKKKMKDSDFRVKFEESKTHLKVARIVEELRLKAGMTQKELAEKTGVSQPLIARLENGDQDRVPTLATINKVLNALGYEVDLVIKKAS